MARQSALDQERPDRVMLDAVVGADLDHEGPRILIREGSQQLGCGHPPLEPALAQRTPTVERLAQSADPRAQSDAGRTGSVKNSTVIGFAAAPPS